MDLEAILERNRAYARSSRPLGGPSRAGALGVLACDDPKLADQSLPALGLEPAAARLWLSTGPVLTPGGELLRSMSLAVFEHGIEAVVVLGHTDCSLARFEAARFIESFRARGVPRSAFGSEDLRTWAGARAKATELVRAAVTVLLETPFLPRDLAIAGLVLDETSGLLEVVHRPGEAGPAAAPAEAPLPTAPVVAPPAAAPAKPAPVESAVDPSLRRAFSAVLTLIKAAERESSKRHLLFRLWQDLARERNLTAMLVLLDQFVREAAGGSRELLAALDQLRRETTPERRQWLLQELHQMARRALAKE
jgi:carbonic anhydrase